VLAALVAVLIIFKNGTSLADRSISQEDIAASGQPPKTTAPLDVRIIDGDTIVVDGEHMRLFGIDAPERGQVCTFVGQPQRCGLMAAEALRGLIGSGTVSCERRSTDRYGRTVAVCSVAGRDIGRQMVYSGWAIASIRYSNMYIEVENEARGSRRGLWDGQFEKPEQWRAAQRSR
jgi:endonuclease YncB( thermonuclease family)